MSSFLLPLNQNWYSLTSGGSSDGNTVSWLLGILLVLSNCVWNRSAMVGGLEEEPKWQQGRVFPKTLWAVLFGTVYQFRALYFYSSVEISIAVVVFATVPLSSLQRIKQNLSTLYTQVHEIWSSCFPQVITLFLSSCLGRLWKSYWRRQNEGEPELKQWEQWAGKLCQKEMSDWCQNKCCI